MNLFELMAKISLDTKEFDSKLDGLAGKVKSAAGGAVKTAAKTSAAIVGGAATSLAAITKASVSAYANYEQLEGGIATLYGENTQATEMMMANADKAWKTAGMSANEYMETAIESSAAMLNSLGGNADLAAQKMDMSIQDMADNVNKMGTSMESIQNAYRGFSRGNFTMLDNLSLGFAGTKEGMQQLIAKANELREAQDLDLRELSIDSYADIVEAIHTVQDEMGITGTTADEAAKTISGSLNAVKSSWKNIITYMASGDANGMKNAMDSLVIALVGDKQGEGLINQLKPAILNAVKSIGTLITKVAPVINSILPQIMNEILPPLVDSLVSLIETAIPVLAQLLPNLIIKLLPALVTAFITLVSALIEQWPTIWAGLKEAMSAALDAVEQGINEKFPFLGTLIKEFIENLVALAPIILTVVGAFKALSILGSIIGFFAKLPSVIAPIITIIGGVAKVVSGIGTFITATLIPAISAVGAAILPILPIIAAVGLAIGAVIAVIKNWDAIVEVVQIIGEGLKNLWLDTWQVISDFAIDTWNGICDFFSGLWQAISDIATAIWTAISDFFTELWQGISDTATAVWTGICDFISGLWQGISDTATAIWTGISDFFGGLWQGLSDTASSIWTGVSNFFGETWNTISTTASNVWNGITGFLGDTWDSLSSTASSVWSSIKEGISSKWDAIKEHTSNTWSNVKSGLSSAWDNIKSGLGSFGSAFAEKWNNISQGVKDTVGNLVSSALTWGKDLVQNFISGITGMIGKVKDAVGSVASAVKSFLGFSEPEDGPLSNFHTYAPDMIDLFTKGIYDNMNQVKQASSDLAAAIRPAMPEDDNAIAISGNVATATAGMGGDLIIPVYIGANKLDEILIKQEQLINYRSGGR